MKQPSRLARVCGLAGTLLAFCVPAQADTDPPAAAAATTAVESPKPCSDDHYRGFDFWIGEWTVSVRSRPGWSAQSSITAGNDGCSIHENYTSRGYTGSSINFYDRADQKWHQTWIDNQGGPLYLEGGIENGQMVLADSTNRITWSVEPDNTVRQHWQKTTDGGATWATAFDGYYARRQ